MDKSFDDMEVPHTYVQSQGRPTRSARDFCLGGGARLVVTGFWSLREPDHRSGLQWEPLDVHG